MWQSEMVTVCYHVDMDMQQELLKKKIFLMKLGQHAWIIIPLSHPYHNLLITGTYQKKQTENI